MVNETTGRYIHSTIMYIQLVFLNIKVFVFICVHDCHQYGRGNAHDNDVGWAVKTIV